MATKSPSLSKHFSLTENERNEAIKVLASNGFDVADKNMSNKAALYWACAQDDLKAICLLAEGGVDVASMDVDDEGASALHISSSNNNCEAVELLLKLGSDPYRMNKDGNTAMHYSAAFGAVKAFQLLVDAGSDITWGNNLGRTALHLAAYYGREEMIETLHKMGAEIDARDTKGRTPLHLAALIGMHKALQLLINIGADLSLNDGRGDSPLQLAALGRSLDVQKILVQQGADLQAQNNEGYTAISLAAGRGDIDVMQLLLDNGADIDLVCSKGRTPLHYAASMGHENAMRMLIEKGADIEARDNVYGLTPLAYAARDGHEDTNAVKFLADHGADLFVKSFDDWTVLHLAAEQDHRLVAQLLIKEWRGRSLDDQAEDGATALAIAADMGHKDMVILLLKGGADLGIADNQGYTPLHQAVSSGHMDIARVLLNHGADPTLDTDDGTMLYLLTSNKDDRDFLIKERNNWVAKGERNASVSRLLVAAAQGHLDQLERLLDNGLDVNSRDENGRRALSLAAQNGQESSLEFLIERGAGIHETDKTGESAIWWAARYGHEESLVYLLDKGCRIDVKDGTGQTALLAAAQMGHEAIVELLIKRGASLDVQTRYGISALSFAAQEGHLDVVAQLLRHGAQMDANPEDGKDAVSLARFYGHDDVAELLLQHKAQEQQTKNQSTSPETPSTKEHETDKKFKTFKNDLASSAKLGRVARMKRLIAFGTPVDCLNSNGRSPLSLAAEFGHDDVVMELLQAGATVEFIDKEEKTALAWAAEKGQISTITLLTDAGAKMEAKDEDGKTPLSIAVLANKMEAVRLLLHLDARTESRDDRGRSPLFHAAEVGYNDIISLLLENGANLECGDKTGRTPLYAAVESNRRLSVRLLLEKGAQMRPESLHNWSPLCIAAQFGMDDLVEVLLIHGADVNYRSDGRMTALMLAAEQGHAMVIKILIEHGADVDLRDEGGHNALSYAKNVGQEAPLQLLWQVATIKRTAKAVKTRKTVGDNKIATQEWYEYEPLPNEDASIRLIELRPGIPTDIIALELFTVSLNKIRRKASYEALSYEWGEKKGSIPIQCNGNRLLITPNLRVVLEKLRSTTESRILWVDAVCINQEDIPERGKQVALMTQIYREATSVLMWIGPDKACTQDAFTGLHKFVQAYDEVLEPEGGIRGGEGGAGTKILELLKGTVTKSELEGMQDIYSRAYFTRAWIFQEILLSGPKGIIISGEHHCEWTTMRKALVAFSCSNLHGVALRSFKMLYIIECEDTFNENGGLELEDISDIRRSLDATDPRDKVYATLGTLHPRGQSEIVPDYSLSTREVYIKATRYLIRKTQNLGYWWSVCNRGSIKTVPNLPSWVPDWTATEVISNIYTPHIEIVSEVTLLGTRLMGRFIQGDPTTTDESLFVNGYIMDRLAFGASLSWGDDVYEAIFKPVAIHLSTTGASLFEPYSPEPSKSKLNALWDTISPETPERSKILDFLAWKISDDQDIPAQARNLPAIYESSAREWTSLSSTQGDYDFAIYKAIESKLRHSYDLVYTEKGRFALTNLHGTEPRLVVAILGGARDVALLRERKEAGERWYCYMDRLYMPDLEKMEKPEDVIEHDKVERLEIR